MNRATWFLSLVVVMGMTGGCQSSVTPPGYNGPVPSGPAQQALKALNGQTLRFPGSEEDWTVVAFGVVPNPVTGKGPVLLLERAGQQRHVPVETDGDVADLVNRITGQPSTLAGSTSPNYQDAMGL